jgi:hypothetical protein
MQCHWFNVRRLHRGVDNIIRWNIKRYSMSTIHTIKYVQKHGEMTYCKLRGMWIWHFWKLRNEEDLTDGYETSGQPNQSTVTNFVKIFGKQP